MTGISVSCSTLPIKPGMVAKSSSGNTEEEKNIARAYGWSEDADLTGLRNTPEATQLRESINKARRRAAEPPSAEEISKLAGTKTAPPPPVVDYATLPNKDALVAMVNDMMGQANHKGPEIVDNLEELIPQDKHDGEAEYEAVKAPEPDDPDISYEDLRSFIQHIAANKPFSKVYDLLGSNVRIKFRELPTAAEKAINKYLASVTATGHIKTESQYQDERLELRMCSALVWIELSKLGKRKIPKLDPSSTVSRRDWVLKTVLNNTALKTVVTKAYEQFDSLFMLMAEKAGDPNFISAIRTPFC